MALNDDLEDIDSLLLVHGYDGKGDAVGVGAGRERFSTMLTSVFLREADKQVVGRDPLFHRPVDDFLLVKPDDCVFIIIGSDDSLPSYVETSIASSSPSGEMDMMMLDYE